VSGTVKRLYKPPASIIEQVTQTPSACIETRLVLKTLSTCHIKLFSVYSVHDFKYTTKHVYVSFCRNSVCRRLLLQWLNRWFRRQGRSQHFWFGGLSPEAHLLPFLLPFLPLLLRPSLSFSFSFRLLPFFSRILFSGIPSPLKLAISGERCGITSSQCGGKGIHIAQLQCSRGTVNSVMLQFTWNLNLSDSDLTAADLLTITTAH